MCNGFIVINRSIQNWQYWSCESGLAIWMHILIKANWKDGWFMGETIPRGSFATSIHNLAEEIGVHPNTVRTWLKKFRDAGQIEIKSTNRFTLISVVNYDKYQSIPDDSVKQNVKQNVEQNVKQDVKPSVNQSVNPNVDNRTNKQSNKETNISINNRFTPPVLEEVEEYCLERNNNVNPQRFIDFYSAKGWMVGKNKMKDWKAAVRTWEKTDNSNSSPRRVEIPDYMREDYQHEHKKASSDLLALARKKQEEMKE